MSSQMKAQDTFHGLVKRTALVFLVGFSTGCLVPEAGPLKEEVVGTPTTTPADFTVTSTTTAGTSSGNSDTTPVNSTGPTAPISQEGDAGFNYDLVVNNGVAITNQQMVPVTFIAPPWFASIKLGKSTDCSDGAWVPWTDHADVSLSVANASNTISVQYRDYDFALSPCLVRTIRHDNRGPDIVISKYPLTSLEEGSATELIYSVTDDASQITSTSCSLNGITKACQVGKDNKVAVSQMPAGDYQFAVEAVDSLGNKSAASVRWSVVNTIRTLTQSVDIKDDRKVDILFVIDNSGSMGYEQKSMANRVGRMLSVLNGLDWQIAVTTTDPTAETSRNPTLPSTAPRSNNSVDLTDGRLIPIYGSNGQYILDTTTSIDTAQYRLGMTLQRPEIGSGLEQGIYATYRFIERSQSTNPAYKNFFRDGANFAVVIISDEDESANGTKNDPQNLINLVSSTFKQQKVFTWHSIITKPNDSQCRSTYGATYGERLARLSNLTGGLIGSVCETDYAKQVEGIADGIKSMNKSLGLTCEPLTQFPITIEKDGVVFAETYTKEGLNLKFKNVLAPGKYTIQYRCLK